MQEISVARISKLYKKSVYILHLNSFIKKESHCELYMEFEGHIWSKAEGLFYGSYKADNKTETIHYIATNLHPNNARRLFPCFDEPEFKANIFFIQQHINIRTNWFYIYITSKFEL